MSGYWSIPDDYAYEPAVTHGSAHSVSSDSPDEDVAEQVRQVAEEVTGKPVHRPQRPLGFY